MKSRKERKENGKTLRTDKISRKGFLVENGKQESKYK